ncbi:hypothetical protein Tdes44962_MAKER09426 [Teratosphaeria destructans]|uniref:Uncharacterized protein n=1 Tax=Teratosphaeria destructans TaxID=418781 RepID=A0A9W7STI8_9PEZI|nr:hypothetical protein Tdes44962_MAKER09426 [Teratosphaeria destructans]
MISRSSNKTLKPEQLTSFIQARNEQDPPAYRTPGSTHPNSAHSSTKKPPTPQDLRTFVERHTRHRPSTPRPPVFPGRRIDSGMPDRIPTIDSEPTYRPMRDAATPPGTVPPSNTGIAQDSPLTEEDWFAIIRNANVAGLQASGPHASSAIPPALPALPAPPAPPPAPPEQPSASGRKHPKTFRWTILVTFLLIALLLLLLPFTCVCDPDFRPRQSTPLHRALDFVKHMSEDGQFDAYSGNLEAFLAGEWQAYHLLCTLPQAAEIRQGTAWYREGYKRFVRNTTEVPPNFTCASTRADWVSNSHAKGLEHPLFDVAKTIHQGRTVADNISVDLQQKFTNLHKSLRGFDGVLQHAKQQEARLWPTVRRAIRVFESPDPVTGSIHYQLWVAFLRIPWTIDKILLPVVLGEPLYFDLIDRQVPNVARSLLAFTELDTFADELGKFSGHCYGSVDRAIYEAKELGVVDFEFSEGMHAIRQLCDWAGGKATSGSWAVGLDGWPTKGLARHLQDGLPNDLQTWSSTAPEWVHPRAIASLKAVVYELEAGVGIKYLPPDAHD